MSRDRCREKYSDNEYSEVKNKYNSESDSDKHCECKMTRDFESVYNYYKYLLETDTSLMMSGTKAFTYGTNTIGEVISQQYPIPIEKISLAYNVDHLQPYSPFHVRQSGLYIYYLVITSDQAAQITLFINGIPRDLDRVGNNSGSGQLTLRGLLELNDGDSLIVRNSTSSSASITSDLHVGGTQAGNPGVFLLLNIGPLNPATISSDFDIECLSRKEKKLFRKIKQRLIDDAGLMVRGFNVTGDFYTQTVQNIPIEGDVQWDNYVNTNNITWNSTAPQNINIMEDGYYKLFAILNVDVPAQISFCINNIPNEDTTQGIDKPGQLSLRTIKALRKGDVVTVRNHTSATPFNLVAQAGGTQNDNAASFVIFKCGVLDETPPVQDSKLSYCKKHYYKNVYPLLVNYLLCQPELMIIGTKSYISIMSDTRQDIELNQPVEWNITTINKNLYHRTGTTSATIEISGIYDLSFDILTDQAAQCTLFINGIPNPACIFGRTSGAARLLGKSLVLLNSGDVVSIVNYSSNAGTIVTALNSGGINVDKNRTFVLILLTPLDTDCKYKSMKCKPWTMPKVTLPTKEYIFN